LTNAICTKVIAGFFDRCSIFPSSALNRSLLALLLIATSGFAVASDQTSNANPCQVTEDEAIGRNGDLSTDVHAARDYAATIADMRQNEKFGQLDCLADRARSGKERFPGGTWKLHELYRGLSTPVQYPVTRATEEDWHALLQPLQRWVVARPKSITARVALAWANLNYAYDARGTDYADTV
jgi:hypothetical protein